MENYTGKDDWRCCCIRGTCPYVCRTKQGRKTRVLWGSILYDGMYNVTNEVSH